MKSKFAVVKSVVSFVCMIAFMAVAVYATQQNRVDFEGNFKFESNDVLANIVVSETFVENESQVEDAEFDTVGSPIALDSGNKEGYVVLGNEGMIEFTTMLPVYVLKLDIQNNFKVGGRNILVDFDYFWEEFDFIDVNASRLTLASGEEVVWEDEGVVLKPSDTLTIMITFALDTQVAPQFDTSTLESFEIFYLKLVRG